MDEDAGEVYLQPYDQTKPKICIKKLQLWEGERYLGDASIERTEQWLSCLSRSITE